MKCRKKFRELEAGEACPCGSGKTYGACCKGKAFRYGFIGKRMVKKVPMTNTVQSVLTEEHSRFQEYYGRQPNEKDYVISFAPMYNDEFLTQTVYAMREQGIDESIIYAYYKSGGILPVQGNLKRLPEVDIAEFNRLCGEYRSIANKPIEGHQIDALQYVMFSNGYIEKELAYIQDALSATSYDFIHRHTNPNEPLAFTTKSCLDFCIFSVLKTVKTLESIRILQRYHLTECILALGRSLFENYMYLCAIDADPGFFQEKLLPMMDEENYELLIGPNGRISHKKAVERSTGKHVNVKVVVAELKKYFTSSVDRDIYNSFYQEACQYVHVDILSAEKYFSVIDIYDQLDPSLIAGISTAVMVLMVLKEISRMEQVQAQYREDLQFLLQSLGKRLISCLHIADADPENKVELVPILRKRLEEYGYGKE